MKACPKFFLPYQTAWINDSSHLKICEKARQVGMSYADSYDSVRRAAPEHGKDVWVMSRDEVQARQYVLYCKRWANVMRYAARDLGERVFTAENGKPISIQVLKFASGAHIYALSSNPDAIIGKTGHVKLDEFAVARDQRALYTAAKPVIQWGGTLSIISTHRGVGTVFNSILTDIRERGNPMGWSLHRIPVQTAVDQGLVEKINAAQGHLLPSDGSRCPHPQPLSANMVFNPTTLTRRYAPPSPAPAGEGNRTGEGSPAAAGPDEGGREGWLARQRAECLDEEQWLQEYCCTPADESAAFITYEMIRACEDDTARKDWAYLTQCANPLYAGFDVARTQHLSVIDIEEKVGDVFWERHRIELRGVTFGEQEAELARVMSLPKLHRLCIDSTGLGMQLAERAIQRYGTRVEAVRFTGTVKEELAFPLRAAHEDRTLRYNRDDQLRADLRGIRKETTASGNLRFVGELADSHCDRFWAKALALHAGVTRYCGRFIPANGKVAQALRERRNRTCQG